jgi:WD40 repeat protein
MDTQIKIYNLKDFTLRSELKAAEYGGFTKLIFSQLDESVLFASSSLGNVVVIDIRNASILKTYHGHAAPINDMVEVP